MNTTTELRRTAHTRNHRLAPTLLALVGAAALLQPATAAAVSFQGLGNLGTLPTNRFDLLPIYEEGYGFSRATALSADGRTVVGITVEVQGDEPTSRGFVWTPETGFQRLGVLDGFARAQPTAVSADGSVVAGHCQVEGSPWTQRACRWTSLETVEDLGHLGVPGNERGLSRAYGISDDGQVVVGESFLQFGGTHAFRWETLTGMIDLGDLDDRNEQSKGRAASADGSVVVGYGTAAHGLEAMRWDAVTGMIPLGAIPGGRGWSDASDVSADGNVIVGTSSPSDDPWESEAVVWTAAKGLQRLGDLPGGLVDSGATAISANGQVIVGSGTITEDWPEAVFWDSTGQIHCISDLLRDAGIDLGDWILYGAADVSADGTVILGNGVNPDGNFEAWIVHLQDETPPVIVEAYPSEDTLWPPNNDLHMVALTALVEDDSGETEWGVVGIECNDLDAESDMEIIDDHTVALRAIRSGRLEERIYTISLQAIDGAGNLSEPFTTTVIVPHDQRGRQHAGSRSSR